MPFPASFYKFASYLTVKKNINVRSHCWYLDLKRGSSVVGSDRTAKRATTNAYKNKFLIWAKPSVFLFIFVLFSTQWQTQDKIWLYKQRRCAWDSNPGLQNGRQRATQWAMMPPPLKKYFIHRRNILCGIVFHLSVTWHMIKIFGDCLNCYKLRSSEKWLLLLSVTRYGEMLEFMAFFVGNLFCILQKN